MSTMTPTHERERVYTDDRTPDRAGLTRDRSLVSWSGILSGGAVGLATLFVLQSFWAALGFGSGIDFFADNLAWWGFASSIVAASVGGLVAGYASGRRSPIAGLISGLTVWGLVLFAASAFDVAAAVQVVVGGSAGADRLGIDAPTWESFASIFGGFVITGIGGMIGASMAPERHEIDVR